MNTHATVLDPTAEDRPAERERCLRPESLAGPVSYTHLTLPTTPYV